MYAIMTKVNGTWKTYARELTQQEAFAILDTLRENGVSTCTIHY